MKRLLAVLCMSACLCSVSVTSYAAADTANEIEAIDDSQEVEAIAEEEDAASVATAATSDEIKDSEAYQNYGETFDGLVQQLAGYSDAELDEILNSTESSADVQLINSWKGVKDDLGAYIGVLSCEAQQGDSDLTVTMEFQFTEKNVTMNYKATTDGVEIGFETKLSMGEIVKKAAMNTVIGMGTVFIVLIFMSFVISLFGFIPKLAKKKEAPKEEEKKINVPVAATPVEEDLTDDLELAAVITAAIVAAEGTSADGVVIRSIKRADNAKWKRA